MALGPAAIKLNLELWQRDLLKDVRSVCDMGSQEIMVGLSEFEGLVRSAGVSNWERFKENFVNLSFFPGQPRCSSSHFYRMLGVEEYACIDLNEGHGAIPLDLNLPLEDTSLHNRFDMVTDFGMNEHAFNVAEAYRTMHRLCKPRGLMVNIQTVYCTNGYYTFDLAFYEGISAANNYRILFSSYVIGLLESGGRDIAHQFHIPLNRDLLDTIDWSKVGWIGICYVLQKLSDDDFQYPYDGDYTSIMSGGERHTLYQLQFLPDPPSRSCVPIVPEKLTEGLSTRVLFQHLMMRVFGKIKRKLLPDFLLSK